MMEIAEHDKYENEFDVCTCGKHFIEEHTCPLKSEINFDDTPCSCCAYCEGNCHDDI